MNHVGHETVKCSCGAIIRQCRCFMPHKPVRVVEDGCSNCQAREAKVNKPPKTAKTTE
jgi:hypothetical protein